jgi:hypothetical protein
MTSNIWHSEKAKPRETVEQSMVARGWQSTEDPRGSETFFYFTVMVEMV